MSSQVVSFHYTLKDTAGKTIESSYSSEPVMYLEGGGQIISGLERELTKLKAGEKKQVSVKAADAYGDRDEKLVVQIPKTQLPKGKQPLQVGQKFQAQSEDGHERVFVVTGLSDTHATLDGNHPLAGQDLMFDVEVVERREPTEEEKAHGHVHGPGGHHHH